MKKFTAIVLSVLLICSILAGCGESSKESTDKTSESKAASTAGNAAPAADTKTSSSTTLAKIRKAAEGAGYETKDDYMKAGDEVAGFTVVYKGKSETHIPVLEFKNEADATKFADSFKDAGYNIPVQNGKFLTMAGADGKGVLEDEGELAMLEAIILGNAPAPPDTSGKVSEGELSTLVGFLDEYTRLYELHESVINNQIKLDAQGAIVGSVIPLANIQLGYVMKNLMGEEEGTFGDKEEGMYTKSGNLLTFEMDTTPYAGESKNMGKQNGDKDVFSGFFDGDKQLFEYNGHTENSGVVQNKTTQFTQLQDGKMSVLYITGSVEREKSPVYTRYVYIILAESEMQFVFAKSEEGAEFTDIAFDPGMTVEQAKTAFETAGAETKEAGTIKDGAFTALS